MSEEQKEEIRQEDEKILFSEFLESTPPSSITDVTGLFEAKLFSGHLDYYFLLKPEIQLHCSSDTCNGTRFFRCKTTETIRLEEESWKFVYISYNCSNCRDKEKIFSLAVYIESDGTGKCYKFGELPVYGPPTPSKLISLIGPDRELFLKGRRCENQGLGIGAFVYYRRVVENQKNRILDKIIKVSEKLGVDQESIQSLEAAKVETQFSNAIKSIKGSIPQVLLINGHNPLSLLHTALSDGLHDQTDEHCLELASSIRVVLGELSERLSQALKDEAELKTALSKLLNVKGKNG